MAALQTIVPPPAEPLTLADAKRQLRLDEDFTADDDLVASYIVAARVHVEQVLRRQIAMSTFRLTLDGFPAGAGGPWASPVALPNRRIGDPAIELPNPPLQQVVSVTYIDPTGTPQTLDPTLYKVDDQSEPARLMPVPSSPWPLTLAQVNAVSVVYTAGWMVPFAANATADTITCAGRAIATGQGVRIVNGGDGDLPGGLVANRNYYAISVSGSTCQLSLSPGGSAVDITDNGTGVQFVDSSPESIRQAIRLLVTFFYNNDGHGDAEIPSAIDALLSLHRDWRF